MWLPTLHSIVFSFRKAVMGTFLAILPEEHMPHLSFSLLPILRYNLHTVEFTLFGLKACEF